MVNRGGITFAFRAEEETGATPEQVARAFVVCREVFDLTAYVRGGGGAGQRGPTGAQTALYLEFRRLLDRAVRWFLQNRPVAPRRRCRGRAVPCGGRRARPQLPSLLQGQRAPAAASGGSPSWRRRARRGDRDPGGRRCSTSTRCWTCRDRAETGRDAGEVAPVYFATSEQFGIDGMLSAGHRAAARRPLGRPCPGLAA